MDKLIFENDVVASLKTLKNGGTILYPTDTVWGLGCDATNEEAIKRIYTLKNRSDEKSLIVLVAEERDILKYVASPDLAVFDFIQQQVRPTTIIFDNAVGLPYNLIATDGSIAIRIVKDDFCRHIIKRLRKPLVSTSANISGQPAPQTFNQISTEIINGVEYVVKWRQDDNSQSLPSQIFKWNKDGSITIIRS